jgi:hypothetical protein
MAWVYWLVVIFSKGEVWLESLTVAKHARIPHVGRNEKAAVLINQDNSKGRYLIFRIFLKLCDISLHYQAISIRIRTAYNNKFAITKFIVASLAL